MGLYIGVSLVGIVEIVTLGMKLLGVAVLRLYKYIGKRKTNDCDQTNDIGEGGDNETNIDNNTQTDDMINDVGITSTVRQFCEATTAHGFAHVVQKRNNRTLIAAAWSLLIILAFSANTFHLWSLVAEYQTRPVREKMDLAKDPPQMPSVTICHMYR